MTWFAPICVYIQLLFQGMFNKHLACSSQIQQKSNFSQKIGLDILSKLSQMKTICMKKWNPISWKTKKTISISAEIIPRQANCLKIHKHNALQITANKKFSQNVTPYFLGKIRTISSICPGVLKVNITITYRYEERRYITPDKVSFSTKKYWYFFLIAP